MTDEITTKSKAVESIEYEDWTRRPVPADEKIMLHYKGRGSFRVLPEGDHNRDGSISDPGLFEQLMEYIEEPYEKVDVDMTLEHCAKDPQSSYVVVND